VLAPNAKLRQRTVLVALLGREWVLKQWVLKLYPPFLRDPARRPIGSGPRCCSMNTAQCCARSTGRRTSECQFLAQILHQRGIAGQRGLATCE